MSFFASCKQEHDSDAMPWCTTRYTPHECVATAAELARQRSTMHPRSLILGLIECGILNGGFESGDFTGWTTVTGPGGELTPWQVASAGSGFFGNGVPAEGNLFAQNGFDGDAGLYYDIYQEVMIPAGAGTAVLNWSERIQWDLSGATLSRIYEITETINRNTISKNDNPKENIP